MTSMPAHSDDGRDHASRASSGEARLIAVVVLIALIWPTSAPAAEKIKVTIPAAAVTFASLYHAKAAGIVTLIFSAKTEEHTSELQSPEHHGCRPQREKKTISV